MYDRWSKMKFIDDLQACFKDPEAFQALPARPPFHRFVNFVSSLDREAGIDHWMSQLEGLQRHDLLFPDVKGRPFITSKKTWFRRCIPYSRPKGTKISFDAIIQIAWALVLANISGEDDVFFCAFRSCRQMSLEGVQDIIGPLWSIIPVRHRLDPQRTLQDLLQAVYDLTISGIPHEPFGMDALEEFFGHRRFLQSVLLPQPPQPVNFDAQTAVRGSDGREYRLRSVESLWTQTRGHYGLYIGLTPKNGDQLELWTQHDDRFISAERANALAEQYGDMILKILTSQSEWAELKVGDLCPHIQNQSSGEDEQLPNGSMDDADMPKTLNHLIRYRSKKTPAVIIPTEPALTISHADLHNHISSLEKEFAQLGIKRGSAVSIALPNSLELIVAFLAATWQRGTAAPLNPGYKQDEFEFYINDLGSALVIIPKGAFEKDGPAIKAARKYKAAIAECYWDGKKIALDVKEKGKLGTEGGQEILEAEEDDVGLVLHTSGTTGRPKAVRVSPSFFSTSNADSILRSHSPTPISWHR
jgi:hypothetical protein